MDISVGAEFVIASALIALNQHGIDCVPFDTIGNIGWNIQQQCNKSGIDTIILTSGINIKAAVYDFSDYFRYENIDKPMIYIEKSASIEDIRDQFMFRLPKDISAVIQSETIAYCSNDAG